MSRFDQTHKGDEPADEVERERLLLQRYFAHERPTMQDVDDAYACVQAEEDDATEISERGTQVLSQMRERLENGLSIDALAEVIDAFRHGTLPDEAEAVAPEEVVALISTLSLGESHRDLLRSIVRDSRAGMLSVEVSADGEFVGQFSVQLSFGADQAESLVSMYRFLRQLSEHARGGVTFTFEFQED